MDIEILPAGPIQTNSYLVINKNDNIAFAIDAGPESFDLILSEVKKNSLSLDGVLITHPHWDHIQDLYKFNEKGISVYASADAVKMIENIALQKSMSFPGMEFQAARVDQVLNHGDSLALAGYDLEIRNAPGHCPGSILVYSSSAGCCFTGDVIFDGSVGRTDLPGGDMSVLMTSIREQVYTLPDETILYPGHGSSTLVGKEKISNPFITA